MNQLFALVLLVGLANAQQPTSFNFDGIRYTFYPGEIARSWKEARAFCSSLGKQLAVFSSRAQILNVSDYLSADGGVWTGYITDKSGDFTSNDDDDHPWKKAFGIPIQGLPHENQCGLLAITNGTGIRATDCTLKKAALCSLSNPDAVRAESIRDSLFQSGGEKSSKPASGDQKEVKPPPSGNKDIKSSSRPGDEDPWEDGSSPKSSAESSRASSVIPPEKQHSSGEKKPVVDDLPSNAGDPKMSSKPQSSSKDLGHKTTSIKPSSSTTKKDEAGSSKSQSSSSSDRASKSKEPIMIESHGTRFTYFPNNVLFGGFMEFSRFCEDKGLQPAVFTSRSQMEEVAGHIKDVPAVWTGYSTDSTGTMHSVDEVAGPWQERFAMPELATKQPFMCGLLSVNPGKVGIYTHACASARMALCSAK